MTETPTYDIDILRAAVKADPADKTAKMALADALDGLDTKRVTCPECKGLSFGELCTLCLGKGGIGDNFIWRSCRQCDGVGYHVRSSECCFGAGTIVDHSAPIEAALLRVLAEPHEDRHRLAYADAVEPVDKERAEFVRVQVELSQNADGPLKMYTIGWHTDEGFKRRKRAESLRNREMDLINARRWDNPSLWFSLPEMRVANIWGGLTEPRAPTVTLRPPPHDDTDRECIHFRIERGWGCAAECAAADWLKHGDAICERHPVEKVRLTSRPFIDRYSPEVWVADSVRLTADSGRTRFFSRFVSRKRLPNNDDGFVAVDAMLRILWPGVTFEWS